MFSYYTLVILQSLKCKYIYQPLPNDEKYILFINLTAYLPIVGN